MVANYQSGYVDDEQDYILAMDDFLVNHVGWYRIDTISDTASNRDYVWMSDGEPDWYDNTFPRIIRMRGQSNFVVLYTYETYINSGSNTGEVEDSTNGRVANMTTGIWYTFIGDKERFVFRHRYSTFNYMSAAYLGRVQSLYESGIHPYPNWIKGASSVNSVWGSSGSDDRGYAISPTGVNRYNLIWDLSGIPDGDTPGHRNGKYVSIPANIYSPENSSDYFILGNPRGCYQVSRLLPQDSFITLASGTHKVFKDNTDSFTHAFGPCTDSRIGDMNRIPPVTAQVDYNFRGFLTDANTLANWRLDSDTTGFYVDQTGDYNLVPVNSPTLSNSPLVQAVNFNGSTQSATASGTGATASALIGEWSCEMVFNPSSIPGSGKDTILEFGTNSDGTESENTLLSISLAPNGNINILWEREAAGIDESNTTTGDFITVDRWNYVAVVKKDVGGSNYDIQVWHSGFGDHNPVLRETFSSVNNSTGGPTSFWFLATDSSSTNYFEGSIDAIRIQKQALTEVQLSSSLYRVRL